MALISRSVKKTTSDGRENLRGWSVVVEFNGVPTSATVITHTRGDRWLVQSAERVSVRGIFREHEMLLVGPEDE